MKPAYYNEIDPQKAAWLRELIAQDHIAQGDVDERSIHDVRLDDLKRYRQCHFFAGIGIWSYALRLAGWPDDREAWTGSCPCQPFSDAGKKEAFDDARHLWPVWFPLIRARRPLVCFGEQVASADGLAWFDSVYSDLDDADYACGAVDLCAAGVGAPHRRQRLYFVADTQRWTAERHGYAMGGTEGGVPREAHERQRLRADSRHGVSTGVLDNSAEARRTGNGRRGTDWAPRDGARLRESSGRSASGELADTAGQRYDGRRTGEAVGGSGEPERLRDVGSEPGRPGPVNGFWRDADWIFCRDERWRAVEGGTFPLAHGAPARMGRLRGYGDGIVAPQAAAFVRAYMEISG